MNVATRLRNHEAHARTIVYTKQDEKGGPDAADARKLRVYENWFLHQHSLHASLNSLNSLGGSDNRESGVGLIVKALTKERFRCRARLQPTRADVIFQAQTKEVAVQMAEQLFSGRARRAKPVSTYYPQNPSQYRANRIDRDRLRNKNQYTSKKNQGVGSKRLLRNRTQVHNSSNRLFLNNNNNSRVRRRGE